jgi:myo-inositol-1(or 4)-monophosphatase
LPENELARDAMGDLALLTAAAHEAGDIARHYWRHDPQFWDKGAGAGPVSAADLAVNARLETVLRVARPDYGWLSEESPPDHGRLAAKRVFIIDPIDGTRAFLDGQDSFAHSLAVAEAGRVTAAVVYLPARDTLYTAAADGPAFCNAVPITVSARHELAGASVLAPRPALAPEHWRDGVVPSIERAFRPSLAWRLSLVAEGVFDAMLTLRPAWEWDIAAGALIAERAGATVTDRRGRNIRFNSPGAASDGIIAAPPSIWSELHAALA